VALGSTQPPMEWIPGSFPGVKQQKQEVNHLPLSSTEVMNEKSYTTTPSIRLHSMDSNNFTLFMV